MSRMRAGAYLLVVLSAGVLAVTALAGCASAAKQRAVASARPTPVKPTVNADGRCTAAQLTMIGQPHQTFEPSTLDVGISVVDEIYRNSGAPCTLVVSREVTLTSPTGTSATILIPATPDRYLRHGKRIYLTVRMESIGAIPEDHRRACRAAVRWAASVTVLAGSLKLTFPFHPAFFGACQSRGVLLQTYSHHA
jgi:hypothetical protein